MATAFPASRFVGSDPHAPSVDVARRKAEEAGVADRVHFEVVDAAGFSGTGFDLVATFDSLHDIGDPVGAARHVRWRSPTTACGWSSSRWPATTSRTTSRPWRRAYYGFSTLLCTPASLSQEVGLALGTQAGPARIRAVVEQAGFARCAAPPRRRSTG